MASDWASESAEHTSTCFALESVFRWEDFCFCEEGVRRKSLGALRMKLIIKCDERARDPSVSQWRAGREI